jgi:hypothetical protein
MRALEEAQEAQERRIDARFAMLAAILANQQRGKNQRPYRTEDFMPRHHNRARTREELEAKIRAFCGGARSIGEGQKRASK